MDAALMPMPGALRLRSFYPLTEDDGSCALIYDLERATVLEVPVELQLHIAQALETGDPDEDLLGWLMSEDLLTNQGWYDWHGWDDWGDRTDLGDCGEETAGRGTAAAPGEAAAGEPAAGIGMASGARRAHRAQPARWAWSRLPLGRQAPDEAHGWIDQTSGPAVEAALDLVFRRAGGAARVRLHLDWQGRFPGIGLLERIVVEAKRRSHPTPAGRPAHPAREVSFDLALDPAQVTPRVVGFLAEYPIDVRLRCTGGHGADLQEHQPWLLAEVAVRRLVEPLGDRLTVQCVLGSAAQLRGLWSWAKRLGVRHIDAIRREELVEPPLLPRLASLSLLAPLAPLAPRSPLAPLAAMPPPAPTAAQPRSPAPAPASLLSRVRDFRRDLQAICDETSSALETDAPVCDFQPLTRILGRLMRGELPAGSARDPGLAGAPSPDAPCQGCWARQLCSHSTFVASPPGEEPREPSEERCAFWLAEVEAALRLYHRLTQADAIQVLRAFGELPRLPLAGGPRIDPCAAKPS